MTDLSERDPFTVIVPVAPGGQVSRKFTATFEVVSAEGAQRAYAELHPDYVPK